MKHLLTIFVLLLALTCCTTEADRNRMRAGLDSINVRNNHSPLCLFLCLDKAYLHPVVFGTDGEVEPIIAFWRTLQQ